MTAFNIGASLMDLGKKCFGFVKMDVGEIAGQFVWFRIFSTVAIDFGNAIW